MSVLTRLKLKQLATAAMMNINFRNKCSPLNLWTLDQYICLMGVSIAMLAVFSVCLYNKRQLKNVMLWRKKGQLFLLAFIFSKCKHVE